MEQEKHKEPSITDIVLYARWLESGNKEGPLNTETRALLERHKYFEFAQPDESDSRIEERLRDGGYKFSGEIYLTMTGKLDFSKELNDQTCHIVVSGQKLMVFHKANEKNPASQVAARLDEIAERERLVERERREITQSRNESGRKESKEQMLTRLEESGWKFDKKLDAKFLPADTDENHYFEHRPVLVTGKDSPLELLRIERGKEIFIFLRPRVTSRDTDAN